MVNLMSGVEECILGLNIMHPIMPVNTHTVQRVNAIVILQLTKAKDRLYPLKVLKPHYPTEHPSIHP